MRPTTTNLPRIRLAPAAGWTAADLPTDPATVIQYVNVQDSRNIVALDTDGTWQVLRVNSILATRILTMPTDALLLFDLSGATHYEVIGLP